MQQILQGTGWVEVVCGPMFSGKTGELLRRLKRAELAKVGVQLFKPEIDNRYSLKEVVSHDDSRRPAQVVKTAKDLSELVLRETRVIGIDEAQFFDADLIDVIDGLAHLGKVVILACLDQDWRGAGFHGIPEILARAEYVTKLTAICVQCGNPAGRTQRLRGGIQQVEVGGAHQYEARCRKCHEVI